MGIPDSSLIDLIKKVRSWMSTGARNLSCLAGEFRLMPGNKVRNMCCLCDSKVSQVGCWCHCQSCGRIFCGRCVEGYRGSLVVGGSNGSGFEYSDEVGESLNVCKFCSDVNLRKSSDKVHPSPSTPESPDRLNTDSESKESACLASNSELPEHGYLPKLDPHRIVTPFGDHLFPMSVHSSSSRKDDVLDSGRHYFSPSSEYRHENSDIDMHSVSTRFEPNNIQSAGSFLSDRRSGDHWVSTVGHTVQQKQGISSPVRDVNPIYQQPDMGFDGTANAKDCSNELLESQNQYKMLQKPLDFEHNDLLWLPPPPEDAGDEADNNFFEYDDDEAGDSGAMFASSSSLSDMFPKREKHNGGNKEPLRNVIQGHFTALVSQLLHSEGIKETGVNSSEEWPEIVTNLAWQAANFVKPDTRKGGSMDPCDYVKVKCVASGSPRDSTFVKGVVCTKNIKHKRMTSQYKNPRLLILGGALEYQRLPNQLASITTLVQQENYHFKTIISKIEAMHPNVLLVEKSVSSFAQEHLLEKEISLVLNVKRPLLERIAQCTGAYINPSVDSISGTRQGHCELFRIEKVCEEHENANQPNKKISKTLMFFEGCPRKLGCTVLLRGASRKELKSLKHVVLYAVFAAYHLSLETSFLADEGATLPKMLTKHSISFQDKTVAAEATSALSTAVEQISDPTFNEGTVQDEELDFNPERGRRNSSPRDLDSVNSAPLPSASAGYFDGDNLFHAQIEHLEMDLGPDSGLFNLHTDQEGLVAFSSDIGHSSQVESKDPIAWERRFETAHELLKAEVDDSEVSSNHFSAADTHQSILVSFSSRCVVKQAVCERSRLLRIKFYGCFDKPLGRYLRDDLFNQVACCPSCQEPAEAHVLCYTHQQGNLTINVRRLKPELPGARDGKIWMWHRCLRCAYVEGIPPATPRVIMSDAAWGLSFGKFLELSFSNHATANRVATCGHSLQRDCLRYYGFGSMVAFFRYSPIDLLSVNLPPPMLQFNHHVQQKWIVKETEQFMVKMETLYAEISNFLGSVEEKCESSENDDTSELQSKIVEFRDQIESEKIGYRVLLEPACMNPLNRGQTSMDILELNCWRRSLLNSSCVWDCRLNSLDSLVKTTISKAPPRIGQMKDVKAFRDNNHLMSIIQEPCQKEVQSDQKKEVAPIFFESSYPVDYLEMSCHKKREEEIQMDGDTISTHASILSERIDSAWTGPEQLPSETQTLDKSQEDGIQAGSIDQITQNNNPVFRRLKVPMRNQSFDSALRIQERIRKGLPPASLHLPTLQSSHASGDYRSMVRNPVSSVMRTYTQVLPWEILKFNLLTSSKSAFIPSAFHLTEGARLLLPQRGCNDIVIAIYDNEPTSIISYALTSKEYEDWVTDKFDGQGGCSHSVNYKEGSVASSLSSWQSFDSLNMDYIHYGSYGSADLSSSISSLFTDPRKSPHLRITFSDESLADEGKVNFSVTCYFAKEFDYLRKKCCPIKENFIRSLSRCCRWSAQGGKSNVYFAKSLDERFIIKQVTKTELESFEDFAYKYFKYIDHSMSSGSPTCLAKVLGIYQVIVKHKKGGKETKMDLMVMENLFFARNVSRIYDLKGSARSRYNPDTNGKVLLDMNLLESLRTQPLFLGSKAKRSLERAVWNDTSFLASADVMDYSLLVGVDEERKELVLGIIDYMRQYTWDKHLETWVKASGLLGGPKESPTVISPKQYKKRFRKAMTTYFLTVPDQWSFNHCELPH